MSNLKSVRQPADIYLRFEFNLFLVTQSLLFYNLYTAMSDTNTNQVQTPPPSGDPQKAERYLNILIDLINTDRLKVFHSDLRKYDPTSLQDHYNMQLENYEVEVSHSKQPESGNNSYVMVFSNIKMLQEKDHERVILAFTYLTEEQFSKFRETADKHIQKERKKQEEEIFKEAMLPIDDALENLLNQQSSNEPIEEPPPL